MNRKIKALLVMPNREVQIVKCPANQKFISHLVGPSLQKIKLTKNIFILASGDAKVEELNRILCPNNFIAGDFLIVKYKKGAVVSLSKDEIHKYFNKFKLYKHEEQINNFREIYLRNYYASNNVA